MGTLMSLLMRFERWICFFTLDFDLFISVCILFLFNSFSLIDG